jgi:hypothetical protein
VRFLYDFDNLLLSHAERSRVFSDDAGILAEVRNLAVKNGVLPSFVLIDGFVGATWAVTRTRQAASIVIHLFASIDAARHDELEQEAAAILAFLAPDAESTETRIVS